MKWTYTALLIAGLVSCKEDDNHRALPLVNDGEVHALRNGEDASSGFTVRLAATTGSPLRCFPGNLTLLAMYSVREDILRQSYAIENIPLQLGTHPIQRVEIGRQTCGSDTISAYFGTSVSDGDVNGDIYLPVADENNIVSITSLDETTGKVEGTFQMTLAIELNDYPPYKSDANAPDTIRLTQGWFSATVREN